MQPASGNITTIIIEDHSIFTEGLKSILQQVDSVKVVATFTDGESALAFLAGQPVELVLLDISLPGMSGVAVCEAVKQLDAGIKVIALTNHAEKSMIMEMLHHGADGYLLKNTSRKDLVTAIQQVMDHQFLMPQALQKIIFSAEKKAGAPPRLTQREREILQLVAAGSTTTAIAKQLFISPLTVETHRHNLMRKLEVTNAAALIRKAGEHGLL